MKKILGICGSPRTRGNSEWALESILEKCSSFAETEQINIATKNVLFCDGCLICENDLPCPYNDDMIKINNSLLSADIIIISTPVYFDNVPAKLKNVFDRSNSICNRLKGKKAFVVTFGQADESSWQNAIQYLKTYFDIIGVELIDAFSFLAREIDDAKNCRTIVENIDFIVKKVKENL